MNRLKATNSVAFANRSVAPASGTAQYATDGNPSTGVPATIWPAYAFNQVQDEIMAVITAAGITPDDTNWAQLLQAVLSLPGKNVQVFASSGTYTVPSGVTKLKVWVVGGGGGAAGSTAAQASSGGGAGGTAIAYQTVTPGQAITVTIGGGGSGGNLGGNAGSAGGTSSFGSYATATGGGGAGFAGTSSAGGGPGIATGAAINISGGCGDDASVGSPAKGGQGGASYMGGGGRTALNTTGIAGNAYGSGGGGSYGGTSAGAGGAGAPGVVIVEY